jgi:hypothetical protein
MAPWNYLCVKSQADVEINRKQFLNNLFFYSRVLKSKTNNRKPKLKLYQDEQEPIYYSPFSI